MPELKPYLRFFDNLTQIYINQYTIGIVLIAIKLYLFTSSVENRLDAIEKAYTGAKTCLYLDYLLYESPRQISLAANYLIKKGLSNSLKVFFVVLSETLLVCSSVIYFILDIWLGTYACLFTVAAQVTVDVATNATEAVINVSNKTIHAAAIDLNKGLNGLSEGVDDLIQVFDKVEDKIKKIFSSKSQVDQTNITKTVKHINLTIASLNDFYINPNINDKLKKLSGEVPDFSTLKNKTKHWIETPFLKVSNEMRNQDFDALSEPLNSSVGLKPYQLVLPNSNATMGYQTHNSSKSMKWCEQELVPEIKHFMKGSKKGLVIFKKVIIALAVVLFIASLVPEFYKEFFFWAKMSRMRGNLEEKLMFDYEKNDNYEKGDLFTESSSSSSEIKNITEKDFHLGSRVQDAYLMTFQDWQINLLGRIPILKQFLTFNSDTLLRKDNTLNMKKLKRNWTVKYMLSTRASFLLLICILGYLVCFIQYLVIHRIDIFINGKKHHHKNKIFNLLFKGDKIEKVSNAMTTGLLTWQNNTNVYINGVEERGNNEVVMKSIDYIADKVNSTAMMMYSDIENTIDKAFNKTVFDKPLKNLMNCVVGNKLLTISKGAMWVKYTVKLDLPKISVNEAYGIFERNSTGMVQKIRSGVVNIEQEVVKDMNKVIDYYHEVIRTEVIIISALFLLYLLQYLVARVILRFRYRV